jgi:hypothetical protein
MVLHGDSAGSDNSKGTRCIHLSRRYKTMPNQAMPNLSKNEKPSTLDEVHTAETGEDERLDRLAEGAAEKAGKTEKQYDRDHDIFTK